MALGTLTVVQAAANGPIFVDEVSFAGDGAYPTGGTPSFQVLYRAAVGKAAREILAVVPTAPLADVVQYDKANDKLMVRNLGDGLEKAGSADLSGTTYKLLVVSK